MPDTTEPKTITLFIDGDEIIAASGQTVLDAARMAGIRIPTLCFHPALKPSGSCKLCAVAVAHVGERALIMLSCVLKVKSGMVIRTHGEDVHAARTNALKRLVSMAPHSGRLREIAAREAIDLPPASDGCIRCRLCVRVCKEIVGHDALRMEKKDGHLNVMPNTGRCMGCGACANLCPTRAIEVVDEGRMRTIRKGDLVFGQQRMESCEGCGKYYATEQQIHWVQQRTGPHPRRKGQHRYCPACAKLFSDRMQVMHKQPPKQY